MKNEFDHRILGAKYDLFSFCEEGPGFPFWHENGLRVKNALISYWKKIHRQYEYKEVQSPIMLDKKLWQRSGHCDYFENNMYFSSVDKKEFAIKPMNCPGAILIFNQKRRSHAELPMRLCELGHVHRNEDSGSLHGLMRVRSFVQDDAHIFCREDQLLSEIKSIIRLIEIVMKKCGPFDFSFELSIRGQGIKKYLGPDDDWSFAENMLEEAVKSLGHQVISRPGEAKFYGPSLDLHLKDIHGRSWQCSSIQLDFNLPSRFDLHYFDEKGQRKVPYMIHRAIFGSLERFIGILLENYGKDLPFWLHPVQYKILCIDEVAKGYALEIYDKLIEEGSNVEIDLSDNPLKEKIKKAHEHMVHSIIVIGQKELQNREYEIRSLRGNIL